jgi:cytochrome o ubiquinol oxidase subunit 2
LLRRAILPIALLALSGCNLVVLNPTGDVALQQRNLILIATGLMLVIIVPVLILTVLFAWHYRAGNAAATYDPKFNHSTTLELVIWSAPLLIIIALGAVTWTSTHLLDPYRSLGRLSAGRPIPAGVKPLEVQAVAMDWKWMFIYPEQGVATVNELTVPVDRPVHFTITSNTMMNTFSVPTMAGMVYAMPGMQSQLSAIINKAGDSWGQSANYSGAGYSDMRFGVHALPNAQFDQWVGRVKAGAALDPATYIRLEQPSEKVPVMHFGSVTPGLFSRIVNRCVEAGKPCAADVMARDMKMGGGNPDEARPGSGNPPVHESMPMNGTKPVPALMKRAEDKGSGPNVDMKRTPPPGQLKPGHQKNRNFSLLTPLPGAPLAAARA